MMTEKQKAYARAWRLKNRDKVKTSAAKWRINHPEKQKARVLKWKTENADKNAATDRARRLKNIERRKTVERAWRKANKDKVALYSQNRRAMHKNRLHPQSDKTLMAAFSKQAGALTRQTGIRHSVDHIIALAAGGWHHQDNMQVLPHSINAGKGANPLWEMPGCKSWRDVPEHLWPEQMADQYRCILLFEQWEAAA